MRCPPLISILDFYSLMMMLMLTSYYMRYILHCGFNCSLKHWIVLHIYKWVFYHLFHLALSNTCSSNYILYQGEGWFFIIGCRLSWPQPNYYVKQVSTSSNRGIVGHVPRSTLIYKIWTLWWIYAYLLWWQNMYVDSHFKHHEDWFQGIRFDIMSG